MLIIFCAIIHLSFSSKISENYLKFSTYTSKYTTLGELNVENGIKNIKMLFLIALLCGE